MKKTHDDRYLPKNPRYRKMLENESESRSLYRRRQAVGKNGWEPLLGRDPGRPAYRTSGKKRLDRSLYPVPIQTYSEENCAQENIFDCSSLVPAPAPRKASAGSAAAA